MNRTRLLSICFIVYMIIPSILFCYESDHTHPSITTKAITQYNINIPGMTFMVNGSIEEDYPGIEQLEWSWPRYYNHFFGPNGEGWKGWPNAKDFAISSTIQNAWVNYTLLESPERLYIPNDYKIWIKDFSYENAVRFFNNNDNNNAYLALGHVSHLLEDMGSPPHVWNDTHILDLWTSIGQKKWVGDPYEYFVNEIFNNEIKNNLGPVNICSSPGCLFDKFSNYTRSNYFSKDFINVTDQWKENHGCFEQDVVGNTYLICNELDENGANTGKSYFAARKSILYIFNNYYGLDEFVYKSYWDLLSGKTVSYVGGLINLFQTEVNPPPTPPPPVTRQWTSPVFISDGFNYYNYDTAAVSIDQVGNALALSSTGYNNSISVSQYSSATGLWSVPQVFFTVLPGQFAGIGEHGIVMDGSGNATVVWVEGGASGYYVYARRYVSATGQWEPTRVLDSGSSTTGLFSPSLKVDINGNVLATWAKTESNMTRYKASWYK